MNVQLEKARAVQGAEAKLEHLLAWAVTADALLFPTPVDPSAMEDDPRRLREERDHYRKLYQEAHDLEQRALVERDAALVALQKAKAPVSNAELNRFDDDFDTVGSVQALNNLLCSRWLA